jgi:hypothetical protein
MPDTLDCAFEGTKKLRDRKDVIDTTHFDFNTAIDILSCGIVPAKLIQIGLVKRNCPWGWKPVER